MEPNTTAQGEKNTGASYEKLEEALQKSESKFRHLIHSNIVGVLFWDIDGGITDANEAFLNMLGYTRDELQQGLDWRAMTPPQWKAVDDEGERQLLASGRHLPFEKQYLHKNGTPVEVIIASSAFEDTGNRQGVTFVLDISERKKAEQLLAETKEQLELTFRNVPSAIWLFNRRGDTLLANDRAARLMGYDNFAEVMAETDHARLRERAQETFELRDEQGKELKNEELAGTITMRTGKPAQSMLNAINRKTGESLWILSKTEPLLDEAGNLMMMLLSSTDITTQKTAEQAIIQEQKQSARRLEQVVAERTAELHRSNESLQQFAHVASHDLKEPVRKIKIFTDRLEEELGPLMNERAKLYLSKVQSATERMFAMIDGVLSYSTLDASRQPIEKVNLNQVMQNIETDVEVSITQKEAVIRYENLPVVEGSQILLYQLFYNLVNNSLKFSRTGVQPVISVRAQRVQNDNQRVQITVQDNGIGFEQEYAEKIFETFIRLHPKQLFEGTGLGLSLCKKIVERHYGTIEAIGDVDQGATFIIELPLHQLQALI